jgi:serine/threonine-protein kinase RsbW
MRPEDAPALACCVWRVFGYSYPNDDLYEPERLAERLRSGAWQSCVAVRATGEIVGHIGLVFHSPDDRVPESDNAIVAPYARGHRLMERMKSFLADHGKSRGLAGIFSEAVTAHIYSQRANVRMGAVETGLMFGYLPKSLVFKDMELPPETVRVSAMMYFLALTPAPRRAVHAPARHVAMLQEIFQHAGLQREFVGSDVPAPAHAPEFALTESTDWNVGTIEAQRYGENWSGHLRAHVEALCRRGMAYILLELPLSDSFTPTASMQAEALGFFFCGIVPEKHADGDLLRFQYWNNFSVPTSSVQTASDFGLKLKDYIGQCAETKR